ncbi:MAG: tetratricopeptide repeat protein [Rhodospirillales bacterium]|nr:tetratricopeptide repeat protein [Rhodospirillales bacterium]
MTAERIKYPWMALAAFAIALPAACASSEVARKNQPVEVGKSLTGNYLAGRHAQAMRDTAAAAQYMSNALKLAGEETELLQRAFLLTIADGRIKDALPMARRLNQAQPNDTVAAYTLSVEDFKTGKFESAGKHVGKLPDTGINVFLAPLMSAWALAGRGKTDEAIEALSTLTRANGSPALRDLHAGIINELAGRNVAAETFYLKVTESETGVSLRVAQLLGGLYERTGQAPKAKALYQRYLDEHPGSNLLDPAGANVDAGVVAGPGVKNAAEGAAEAFFTVASSLRQQNAAETALLMGQLALYLRPDFPIMQILIADILESQERLEAANAVYGSISGASPFAWNAKLRLASNLNRLEKTDEAATRLKSMAKENPSKAAPLVNLGDILRGRQRHPEAVEAYDQAVARIKSFERRHWSLLYARGIALERSKQWDRAEADFLKALEFEPEQPYVLNYLGYSWVEKGVHLDRAMTMIRRAVELRPNDGYIVDSLGWGYYQLGDFEKAVKELERAVELRPEDPVINDHLGDAYWKVGRKQEARFQWRRSLTLKPEPELIGTIESKLERGLVEAKSGG